MATNARITQLADGVTSEMIAETVQMRYDPISGSGLVEFQGRSRLFLGTTCQTMSGHADTLTVTVEAINNRSFADAGTKDPITQADLSQVSTAGLILLIKQAYDKLYNERASTAPPLDASIPAATGAVS